MAKLPPQLYCWAIFLVLLLCQVLEAADLGNEPKRPAGELQVRLDWRLARTSETQEAARIAWVFSTHITFNKPVRDIPETQLAGLTKKAYLEMETDIKQYGVKVKNNGAIPAMPGVMTLLAFDNEIILSSSIKGSNIITGFTDTPLWERLNRCDDIYQHYVDPEDTNGHKNKRSCGEVMALYLYLRKYPNRSMEELSQRDPKVIMTTVTKPAREDIMIIKPCGQDEEDKHGCDLLVGGFRDKDGEEILGPIANYIAPGTSLDTDFELDDLAGGVKDIEQIGSRCD
ncbi:hypothetical protein F66182_8708 [Fusarium sp. NRRL 66182]|nr:hypothetical protein F66182_8708 [Fusarium sp. NRRL 66182]